MVVLDQHITWMIQIKRKQSNKPLLLTLTIKINGFIFLLREKVLNYVLFPF